MEDKILESFAYILPAAITGFVAYYMFNGFLNNTVKEKKLALLAQQKKESLPTNTNDYLELLIANINQEFEHNLVQQIYISDETWTAIYAAKNAVINKLKKVAENASSAMDLRENVLIDYSKSTPPTETAIVFIKKEVRKLL